MVTSVAENKTGTMPGTEGRNEISPSFTDKTPAVVSKVSSDKTPKYTQAELDAAVHAVKSDVGREKAALEKENQILKDQIADVNSDIEKLQTKLDEMASDDPQKFEVAKELRTLRDERRQLKTDRQALDDAKQALEEEFRSDREARFESTVFEIAQEYEGGNHVRLKALCEKTGKKNKNEIIELADALWDKKIVTQEEKETEAEVPPVRPFSGKSSGSYSLANMTPAERAAEADKRLRQGK